MRIILGFRLTFRLPLCFALWVVLTAWSPQFSFGIPPAEASQPSIASFLKPVVYRRMVDDLEVMTHATLEESTYRFYAAMRVQEELAKTRKILTTYSLYSKMIPYVDEANYDEKKRTLEVSGGIWKFRLRSLLRFQEVSATQPNWVKFEIIAGHFRGMKGEFLFESLGEKGTAVLIHGSLTGKNWPPEFVIERGAEIVFGFTGTRMRSFIQSSEQQPKAQTHHQPQLDHESAEFPKPRGRL